MTVTAALDVLPHVLQRLYRARELKYIGEAPGLRGLSQVSRHLVYGLGRITWLEKDGMVEL